MEYADLTKAIGIFLLGLLIGAIFDFWIWPGLLKSIDTKIFGQKEVIINITEIRSLEALDRLQDMALLFGTDGKVGWLAAAQLGHPDLNRAFGDALIPDDFGIYPDHLEYSLTMANTGKRGIRDFNLKITGDGLQVNSETDVSKGIDYVNCGGFGENLCDIRVSRFQIGQKLAAFLRSKKGISIQSELPEHFINFRTFYVQKLLPADNFRPVLNGKIIRELPKIVPNKKAMYFYSQQENIWSPFGGSLQN